MLEETILTSSTTLKAPGHCPAPPDDPESLRHFHRTVQSPSTSRFYRIPMTKTMQSEAVMHVRTIWWWTGEESNIRRTWVATYAKEAVVTRVIPCMRALPDLVALTSFSTELGEVNICLNACEYKVNGRLAGRRVYQQLPTQTRSRFLNRPFQGFSGSYLSFSYSNSGHWSPRIVNFPPASLLRMLDKLEISNAETAMWGNLLIIIPIQTSRTK